MGVGDVVRHVSSAVIMLLSGCCRRFFYDALEEYGRAYAARWGGIPNGTECGEPKRHQFGCCTCIDQGGAPGHLSCQGRLVLNPVYAECMSAFQETSGPSGADVRCQVTVCVEGGGVNVNIALGVDASPVLFNTCVAIEYLLLRLGLAFVQLGLFVFS